jgi:hypothetical protein
MSTGIVRLHFTLVPPAWCPNCYFLFCTTIDVEKIIILGIQLPGRNRFKTSAPRERNKKQKALLLSGSDQRGYCSHEQARGTEEENTGAENTDAMQARNPFRHLLGPRRQKTGPRKPTWEEKVHGIQPLRVPHSNALGIEACEEVQAQVLHPAFSIREKHSSHVVLCPQARTEMTCMHEQRSRAQIIVLCLEEKRELFLKVRKTC